MSPWGAFRLGALAFTGSVAYVCFFPAFWPAAFASYAFFAFVDSFLWSHFLIGFWAGRRRAWRLLSHNRGRAVLFALALASGAVIWFLNPELSFVLFGFHFAFGEAYSRGLWGMTPGKSLRRSHGAFLLALYFFATIHTLAYAADLSSTTLINLRAISVVVLLLVALAHTRQLWRRGWPVDYVAPDSLMVVLATFSHIYKIHWTAIALYHIAFWLFIPLATGRTSLRTQSTAYLLPTIAVFLIGLFIFPVGPGMGLEDMAALSQAYFRGFDPVVFTPAVYEATQTTMKIGVVHILSSLALSTLNPSFIRRWTA